MYGPRMATTYPAHDRPVEDLTARARIRDAAMAEFAAKGYRGATMRGIAAAAGVSVGLVQHHFATKDGLRSACDELVLDLVRFKAQAVDDGTISDPQVLASLMAMGPAVQRYLARALVDGSPQIAELVDELMAISERFLATWSSDRFTAGTSRSRDAAAVMFAVNCSTMLMQDHLARRMQLEPFSEAGLRRVGLATFDAWEAIADLVGSDLWRDLRAAIAADPGLSEEQER
jgi:AcrR family transcriptional regulator